MGTWATPFLLQGIGQPHVICCFTHEWWDSILLTVANSGRSTALATSGATFANAMPMVSGDRVVIMAGFGGPEFAFRLEQDVLHGKPNDFGATSKTTAMVSIRNALEPVLPKAIFSSWQMPTKPGQSSAATFATDRVDGMNPVPPMDLTGARRSSRKANSTSLGKKE